MLCIVMLGHRRGKFKDVHVLKELKCAIVEGVAKDMTHWKQNRLYVGNYKVPRLAR